MTVPLATTPSASPDAALAHCRNCGATVRDAYCPACGQETKIALPTARQFLREAAGRYVAFDGRLWRTLFGLLLRPGFLTREYFAGRRRRYVRPARLFLVLSVALFAVLRLFAEAPVFVADGAAEPVAAAPSGAEGLDVGLDDEMNLRFDGLGEVVGAKLRKRAEYFNRLPRQEKGEQVFLGAVRYGPYAMFALLPAFAALMKLVYFGRARRYPGRPRRYAGHLVFGAHNHAFLCLAVMLAVVPLGPLRAALAMWIVVYFLWAMKSVYGGPWIGVLARAFVIVIAYAVLFAVVTVGLLLAAILLR